MLRGVFRLFVLVGRISVELFVFLFFIVIGVMCIWCVNLYRIVFMKIKVNMLFY